MAQFYCKDCIYWDETGQDRPTRMAEGRCRRHAPHPHQSDLLDGDGTVWPATFADDWCGEGKTVLDMAATSVDLTDFSDFD